jgi:AraC-like DNA-binding protein
MYATLAFAITLLGVFSIFEVSKGNQKFSLLKYYILARLIIVTAGSAMDYLGFSGYEFPLYKEIFKVTALLLTVNLFFLVVQKRIPKQVIWVEVFLILFFIVELFFGLETPILKEGVLQNKPILLHQIFYGLYAFLGAASLFYNAYYLFLSKNSNNNLYELRIRKWVGFYILSNIILFLINIYLFRSLLKGTLGIQDNTMINVFIHRFLFIFFILIRPKFLDDDKYARPFNQILAKNNGVSFQNFEFLFFSNHYYLRQEANMEDFALKLNVSKNQLSDFLKNEIKENFTDLLNKNRVEYLQELLKAKKYESFTIEALSEMCGFSNRRSMYNAFNKYVGVTPTEFIQSLK